MLFKNQASKHTWSSHKKMKTQMTCS